MSLPFCFTSSLCDVTIFVSSWTQTATSHDIVVAWPRRGRERGPCRPVFTEAELGLVSLIRMCDIFRPAVSLLCVDDDSCVDRLEHGSELHDHSRTTPSFWLAVKMRSPSWEYCRSVIALKWPFNVNRSRSAAKSVVRRNKRHVRP